MALIDKSLHYGSQNFFFIESDETTDVTYNFYGFMDKKGMVMIMRMNKAGTAAKYFVSNDDFDTVFAARTSLTYGYPNTLTDQAV